MTESHVNYRKLVAAALFVSCAFGVYGGATIAGQKSDTEFGVLLLVVSILGILSAVTLFIDPQRFRKDE